MEHITDNKKLRWAVLQDIRARIHQGEAREAILADLGRKYYELDAAPG